MLALEQQETVRSVKQPMEIRRLEQSTIDTALTSLLAQDPPALVTAIGENGLFVPMPTSVPLRGHVVIEGVSSALELVVPDDINDVIDCWQAARTVGAARVLEQGCGRYLRSINEREAEVADDPAIGQRAGRDVDHGNESWIGRVDEVRDFRLGEETDRSGQRVAGGEDDQTTRNALHQWTVHAPAARRN